MNHNSKIIYYYQTFIGIKGLLKKNCKTITHINLSSIHFGKNEDKSNYIHLNDKNPNNKYYDKMWNEIEQASKYCEIYLMIGGAGTAYNTLFSDFDSYYNLLKDLLNNKKFITGIDLDIEENVNVDNIKMLMNKLKNDFPYMKFSMAPLASSLINNVPGMGGFVYKELFNSKEGEMIEHFNVQSYDDYSLEIFDNIVKNGYSPNKIVLGMISSQDINSIITEVEKIFNKYKFKFGGIYNWEYFDSPPGAPKNPEVWSQIMSHLTKRL